jgi:predicted transcriptional regulator
MEELVQYEAKNVLGSGNRESLDIIDLILLVCLNGTMKTHIMYKCNLNSKQVQEYLEMILKFELVQRIERESGRSVYETTERGRRFIKVYAELLEIFDPLGERQVRSYVPR